MQAAIQLLASDSASRAKKAAASTAVDEICAVLIEALRSGKGREHVEEATSTLQADVSAAIVDAFVRGRDTLRTTATGLGDDENRVVGVSWDLVHALGDRVTVESAPARSLPVVQLRLDTPSGSRFVALTAEQLHEFSQEVQSAVAAVERVASR